MIHYNHLDLSLYKGFKTIILINSSIPLHIILQCLVLIIHFIARKKEKI